VTYSGIASDCRYLTNKLFEENSDHLYLYGSNSIGKRLALNIAQKNHKRSLYSNQRLFGAKLCIAYCDTKIGSQILEIDPLGSIYECKLTCLGKLKLRLSRFKSLN
jgi:20S proteasome alpha/beta subunit